MPETRSYPVDLEFKPSVNPDVPTPITSSQFLQRLGISMEGVDNSAQADIETFLAARLYDRGMIGPTPRLAFNDPTDNSRRLIQTSNPDIETIRAYYSKTRPNLPVYTSSALPWLMAAGMDRVADVDVAGLWNVNQIDPRLGDLYLRDISAALLSIPGYVLVRMGGDEFRVLRDRYAQNAPKVKEGRNIIKEVTASAGVSRLIRIGAEDVFDAGAIALKSSAPLSFRYQMNRSQAQLERDITRLEGRQHRLSRPMQELQAAGNLYDLMILLNLFENMTYDYTLDATAEGLMRSPEFRQHNVDLRTFKNSIDILEHSQELSQDHTFVRIDLLRLIRLFNNTKGLGYAQGDIMLNHIFARSMYRIYELVVNRMGVNKVNEYRRGSDMIYGFPETLDGEMIAASLNEVFEGDQYKVPDTDLVFPYIPIVASAQLGLNKISTDEDRESLLLIQNEIQFGTMLGSLGRTIGASTMKRLTEYVRSAPAENTNLWKVIYNVFDPRDKRGLKTLGDLGVSQEDIQAIHSIRKAGKINVEKFKLILEPYLSGHESIR